MPAHSKNREYREGRTVVGTTGDFEHLVPDVMLDAVERATGLRMTGFAAPLPSYINRVYEIQTNDGVRLIVKFYRPGRWSREALQEEHDFVSDCATDEIPVVAPIRYEDGLTLHEADGLFFAVFPKRAGRQLEIVSDEDWIRAGRLIGRVHVAGSRRTAQHRTNLHPSMSTAGYIRHIVDNGFVGPRHRQAFKDAASRILDLIVNLFDEAEFMRIHGDCHRGNLLDRPGEGIAIIDFDDMMVGPPVQDLWMLLPEHADRAKRELDLMLSGYESFRDFDYRTTRLIEPLRAMRIIYYLAWCSRQVDDYKFRATYPEWGTDAFWEREVIALEQQRQVIVDHLA